MSDLGAMAIAAAALAATCLLLLVPLPFESTHLLATLEDLAHAPLFGALALGILWFVRRRGARNGPPCATMPYRLSLAITAALGAATEIMQIPVSRDASLHDFLTDSAGATMALGFMALRGCPWPAATRVWLRAAICAGAAFCLVPIAWTAAAYVQRWLQLPRLLQVDSRLSRVFLRVPLPLCPAPLVAASGAVTARGQALCVRQRGQRWPGVTLDEPWQDWHSWRVLAIEVTNMSGAELRLQLRIDDDRSRGYGDRFDAVRLVPANARQRLRIPLQQIQAGPQQRRLDLRHISRITLFQDGASAVPFALHALELEP